MEPIPPLASAVYNHFPPLMTSSTLGTSIGSTSAQAFPTAYHSTSASFTGRSPDEVDMDEGSSGSEEGEGRRDVRVAVEELEEDQAYSHSEEEEEEEEEDEEEEEEPVRGGRMREEEKKKRPSNRLELPEDFDADLYGLRRSVGPLLWCCSPH